MKKILVTLLFGFMTLGGARANDAATVSRPPLNPARSLFDNPIDTTEPKLVAPYVSLRIGGASLSIDGDNYFGGAYAGAVGARITAAEDMAVRIEGEFGLFSFSDSIMPGGNEKNPMTFMANVYLDLLTDHRIKPYVGGGVGFTNHNDRIRAGGWRVLSAFEAELVWGLYGGIGFNLTRDGMLTGDVGVRYTYTTMWGYSVSAMTYNVGARFTF